MKEIKTFKRNPSINDLMSRVYPVKKLLRTKGTREGIVDGTKETISIDERITTYNFKGDRFSILTDTGLHSLVLLSRQGLEVLDFIITKCLDVNKTEVIVSQAMCADVLGMSASNVSRGIQNLIDEGWLFRTEYKGRYWFNVNFCYKGDIKKMIDEYINTGR